MEMNPYRMTGMTILGIGVLITALCSAPASAQTAELHIVAQPGIKLFTDHVLFTETDSAHQEIVIESISAESHNLTCSKEGCYSISSDINLERNHTTYYLAHRLICGDSLSGDTMNFVGDDPSCLVVRSYPKEVHFSIPRYSIISDKVDQTWVANNIPAGPCDLYFQYHDTDIITNVEILPGKQTIVSINLVAHTVEDSFSDECTCCTPDSIGYVAITGEASRHIVENVFEPWEVTDKAYFSDGPEALVDFIVKNLVLPPEAREAAQNGITEVSGTTRVEFVIEPDGTVSRETIRIIGRHIGYGCEKAIIDMVQQTSSYWTPARNDQKLVRQHYRMPVTLEL